MQKEESRPELEMDQPVGLEIAPGRFKMASGTVVIPKARQKKLAEKAAGHPINTVPDFVTDPMVVNQPINRPPKVQSQSQAEETPTETVMFSSNMGQVPVQYTFAADIPGWVVLGLLPQSFIPVSYLEDKNLSFEIESKSVKKCKVVFSGCKFTDPITGSSYITMMKV